MFDFGGGISLAESRWDLPAGEPIAAEPARGRPVAEDASGELQAAWLGDVPHAKRRAALWTAIGTARSPQAVSVDTTQRERVARPALSNPRGPGR